MPGQNAKTPPESHDSCQLAPSPHTLTRCLTLMPTPSPDAQVVIYKGAPETRRELFEGEMGGKNLDPYARNGSNPGLALLSDWSSVHGPSCVDSTAPAPFHVVLTTYELVMKDRLRLKKWKYAYIIIDEGHRMKNAASKLSATLMQV